MIRIAILDDFQNVSLEMADWMRCEDPSMRSASAAAIAR